MSRVHHVLVDSRDRDPVAYPHPNEYRVRLPKMYRNVVAARLLSISIPTTFFIFDAARGTTTLTMSVDDSGPRDVVIPDGNYTVTSMAAELETLLGDAFPALTFQVTVEPRTMQLTIECVEGGVVRVDTSGGSGTLAHLLGFRGVVEGSPSVTGSAVIDINPLTYILMDVHELATMDEGALAAGGVGRGCFARIPLPAESFAYIFRDVDVATAATAQLPPVPKLETLTVTFRTHDGTPLDFQGAEHSYLIEITTREPGQAGYVDAGALSAPAPTPMPRDPPRPVARTRVPLAAAGAQPQQLAGGPPYAAWAAALAAVVGGWWWWSRTGA